MLIKLILLQVMLIIKLMQPYSVTSKFEFYLKFATDKRVTSIVS